MTIIKPCKCENDYQDKKYGKGNRIHNIGGSKERPVAVCTVCENKQYV